MTQIWFTSDTHFQHANIIKYSKRPFIHVDEQDEQLIRRWNARVAPEDVVWHLGDFALGQQQKVANIVRRLHGTIHLIWGNHDNRSVVSKLNVFASTQDVAEISIGNDRIFMSHYGHRVWNGAHRGTYHLYGHSHGSLPPQGRSLDVGVDCWNYAPVSFEEIRARLKHLGLVETITKHH